MKNRFCLYSVALLLSMMPRVLLAQADDYHSYVSDTCFGHIYSFTRGHAVLELV